MRRQDTFNDACVLAHVRGALKIQGLSRARSAPTGREAPRRKDPPRGAGCVHGGPSRMERRRRVVPGEARPGACLEHLPIAAVAARAPRYGGTGEDWPKNRGGSGNGLVVADPRAVRMTTVEGQRSSRRAPIERAPNNLHRLREAQGLTQSDLSASFGIMPKVIRDYERGDHIPTDLQPSLAALFGVSVAHLMGWDR